MSEQATLFDLDTKDSRNESYIKMQNGKVAQQRRILECLKYGAEFNYHEIALITGIQESSVTGRLNELGKGTKKTPGLHYIKELPQHKHWKPTNRNIAVYRITEDGKMKVTIVRAL